MLDDREVNRLIGTELHCVHDFDVTCETCRLRAMCLPAALSAPEIEALESIVQSRRMLQAHEFVYRAGQEFTRIFAVISGAVKTFRRYRDGRICVTGCHLPGELFGFSGISEGLYSINAQALQETWICEFPFDELETSCRAIPGLQSRLLHLMSERIVDYQTHFAQLKSANPVEKRLSALLLSLSARAARSGESTTTIRLPMTGQDVASYLGVSAETVSREFSRLVRNGTIAKSNRDVTILDIGRLRRAVCDGKDASQS